MECEREGEHMTRGDGKSSEEFSVQHPTGVIGMGWKILTVRFSDSDADAFFATHCARRYQ